MKKGNEYDVEITHIRYPNDTYCYLEDKKVYIKNGILGQKVRIRITRTRKAQGEARILEVTELSKSQTETACPHNEKCGGCAWNTLPYEKQLEIKEQTVKDLLENNEIEYENFQQIIPSPAKKAYRNKMEFTFGDETKGGELTLGMHEKGKFNSVVTVDKCGLCDEDFTKILSKTLEYAKEHNLPQLNKYTHEGILRHLLIRKGVKTGEILVVLVTKESDWDFTKLMEEILKLPLKGKVIGVHNMLNNGLSDTIACDRMITLYGRDYFYEEILGLKFKITPFSFFQTNTLGAEILYKEGIESIEDLDSKVVYDLYSGTGTIGQIVAAKAKKVYGIEIVEEAVEAANENARENKIGNFISLPGDVFKMLETLPERPEVIILDPPRAGVTKKAMDKILAYGVNEILYISCNPKTLVDNLKQAIEQGYKVKKIRCVDMFPQTAHVECVCLMTRKGQ